MVAIKEKYKFDLGVKRLKPLGHCYLIHDNSDIMNESDLRSDMHY